MLSLSNLQSLSSPKNLQYLNKIPSLSYLPSLSSPKSQMLSLSLSCHNSRMLNPSNPQYLNKVLISPSSLPSLSIPNSQTLSLNNLQYLSKVFHLSNLQGLNKVLSLSLSNLSSLSSQMPGPNNPSLSCHRNRMMNLSNLQCLD